MKLYHFICISALLILIVFVPLRADAELVWGPSARTLFEMHRDRNLTMFTDFESTPTGLYHLLPVGISSDHPYLVRLLFELDTTEFRYPLPERPASAKVAVCPYDYVKTPPNHRLLGLTVGNIPDGQSKYEIKFMKCLDRVGLKRMFHTNSVTRFYQKNRLLATHRNTTNIEFVGYFVNKQNPFDDCVTRVEFDGHELQPDDEHNKLYMVGPVDDLFYSVPAVFSLILVNGSTDCTISPGDEVKVFVGVKNSGSYTITNPSVRVEYFDHKANQTVSFTKNPTISKEGRYQTGFDIKTTKNTEIGPYKISVSIRSSSGVLVDQWTSWYTVREAASTVVPNIAPLLLNDND